MSIQTVVDVKPCPFCGEKKVENFYVGAMDCTSYGIQCKCGAKIVVRMPNKYNKKDKQCLAELEAMCRERYPEKTPYELWIMVVSALHTSQAIEKWNRRA